jgi:hypothetical protein
MLADVPYFDGIGPPFFKTPPIISFPPMIPIIYPVSIMGKKREKKQVVTLGKILRLYGFMVIETKQGTGSITQVLQSSKVYYSPGAFTLYTNQLPARQETRLIWYLMGKIWRSTNSS